MVKKNSTGKIEFIRLKRDGNSEKRIFGYDRSAMKGSYKNPILIEGDLIVLNKNLIGKATSILNEVGTPIMSSQQKVDAGIGSFDVISVTEKFATENPDLLRTFLDVTLAFARASLLC